MSSTTKLPSGAYNSIWGLNAAAPDTMPTADPAALTKNRFPGVVIALSGNVVAPPNANNMIDTPCAPKARAVKAWPAS